MANLTLDHIKTIAQFVLAGATRYKPNLSVTDADDPRFVVGAKNMADKISAAQTAAATAQTTADSAQSAAATAQTTADSAERSAGIAQNAAGNAQSAADVAQATANNALNAAATAQITAEGAIQKSGDTLEGPLNLGQYGSIKPNLLKNSFP